MHIGSPADVLPQWAGEGVVLQAGTGRALVEGRAELEAEVEEVAVNNHNLDLVVPDMVVVVVADPLAKKR